MNRLKIFIPLERLFISLFRATNMSRDSHATLELFEGKVIPVCTYFTLTVHLLHYCTAHEYYYLTYFALARRNTAAQPIDAPRKTEIRALTHFAFASTLRTTYFTLARRLQVSNFSLHFAAVYLLHSCIKPVGQSLLHDALRSLTSLNLVDT